MENEEKMKKSEKPKSWVNMFVSLLTFLAVHYFGIGSVIENFAQNFIWTPTLTYYETENREVFESSFELLSARVIVHPQIIMEKNGIIILMLDADVICEDKRIQYEKEAKGFSRQKTNWEKPKEFCQKIRSELGQLGDGVAIREVYLIQMFYTKKYVSEEKVQYYVCINDKIEKVTEEVILKRGQDIEVNFDDWQLEAEKIVSECKMALEQLEDKG